MNPLSVLARKLGRSPWVMRLSKPILWVDNRLHALFRGRVSLLGIAGLPSLRLTTVGRKSGQAHSTNLLYMPCGNDFVLIGSNWGRPRDPGWTFNLRAHPDAVVAVRGHEVPVTATPVKGERYDELWARLLEFWPGYAMERARAGRELPIFVLSRRQ